MNKDILKKWLNDELKTEELKALENSSDYESYAKILKRAKYFKAPEFDQKAEFDKLNFAKTSRNKSNKKALITIVASVAAVVLIGFLVIKNSISNLDNTSFETPVAEFDNIELPDDSNVSMNANSSLSYDKIEWSSKRQLELEGEALFDVEKGQKFSVNTSYGRVEVLGTVFNVKSRDYTFEVTCFEGSVQVIINDAPYILKQNDKLVLDHEKVSISRTKLAIPDWKKGKSIINSKTLEFVLNEFKNYYDVQFDTSNIDSTEIFTGSFTHDELEFALNSITLPLGLSYSIKGEMVFLSNK